MNAKEYQRDGLRTALRKKRKELTADYAEQAGVGLQKNIEIILQQTAGKLPTLLAAGFRAFGGEISMQPSFEWMWDFGFQTCLPIVQGETLSFFPFNNETRFSKGQFGIEIPIVEESKIIAATALDIVFVPLVGFDTQGNRLGMGGGFYDKTFAYRLGEDFDHSTQQFIGIAYECQKLDHVPVESWDVPLNAVITESTIYSV